MEGAMLPPSLMNEIDEDTVSGSSSRDQDTIILGLVTFYGTSKTLNEIEYIYL